MAKKRKRDVKTAKTEVKRSRTAHILLLSSVFLIMLSSILTVFGRKELSAQLLQHGFVYSEIALVTYALIWLITAIFAWITDYKINLTGNRNQKWMLFMLSVLTMIAASFDGLVILAGLLMLISSIIYLRNK